jgi:hypothetical protein
MAIYHREFAQLSDEWFAMRRGIPTASSFDKIITAGGKEEKCKPSSQAIGYMNRLLAEWVLGEDLEENPYQSEWMQHGKEWESACVKNFEFQTELEAETIGFVTTDDGIIGCSPDRLVGEDGLLEVKNPAPWTQISYILEGASMPEEYKIQTQGQLWVCERDKCFVSSFHPKLPPFLGLVGRNESLIGKISAAVRTFVDVMLEKRLELERRFGPFVRPEPKRKKEIDDCEGFGVSEADLEGLWSNSV